ncbi:PEP-CTERM sorting domain-containing protein [Oxalobacteraceae bacterium OTU3REALA1]|nr:PEP-CTERM sorting domain-containing protein [Oxalobacteraceae bacterium OTU3REALA1]
MKKYLLALLSSLLMSVSAHATMVTYNYTATVYFIYNYDYTKPAPLTPDSIALTDGVISVGNVLQGQFSYDTATPLHANPDTYGATYIGAAPRLAATAQFSSGVTFASDTGAAKANIQIYDNHESLHDYLWLDAYSGTGADQRALTFNFASEDEAVMDGKNIPDSLSGFDRRFMYFSGELSPTSFYDVLARIDSLTPMATAVPEPETYAMLLAGIGLVGWTAHKRKKAVAAI